MIGTHGTVDILGYNICNGGLQQQVELATDLMGRKELGHYMACANPHSIVVASNDLVFQAALRSASILLPDGIGVVLASRMLQTPVAGRITGWDFFSGVSERLNSCGGARYFFLGSTAGVLELMVTRLRDEYPNITVCGTYSPPFQSEFTVGDNQKMIDVVNGAKPDVLWVGMTAPKQEKWIYENRGRLEVPFSAAIGAVFDFYAGTKKRSSPFWQKLGLEWLPRFLREPRRLWERNLKSTPMFLSWVFKEKAKRLVRR